jgi:hypothetical protein
LNEERHHVGKQQEAKREECFPTSCLCAYIEVSFFDLYRRIKNIVLQKTQNHVFVLFEFILSSQEHRSLFSAQFNQRLPDGK